MKGNQTNNIPKIIHYCWFGGKPLSALAKKCIASWKKYLPDYEIKEWNESNFDVNIIPFTKGAYEAKKFAFVSDFARLWILNKYGGIYFDTDVEVIKDMSNIISAGPYMGCERAPRDDKGTQWLCVNPGLGMGAMPNMTFVGHLLDYYASIDFNPVKPAVITATVTKALIEKGLKSKDEIQTVADFMIYPHDYLSPKSVIDGKINLTPNSVSIHHFDGSWLTKSKKIKTYIAHNLPLLSKALVRIKRILKRK